VDDFVFTDVVVDSSGNVFAAETNNGAQGNADPGELILEITAAGVSTTTPVSVSANPNFAAPDCQIAVDGIGDVFTIAPDYSIREVLPGGQVLLIAEQAAFNAPDGQNAYPHGLAVQNGVIFTSGSVAASDYTGPLEIVALGSTSLSFSQLTTGQELGGTIVGVAADAAGNLYATLTDNMPGFELVKISPAALTKSSLASSQPTSANPYIQLGNRNAVDGAGNLYTITPDPNAPGNDTNGGMVTKTTPAGVTSTVLPLTTSTAYPFGGTTAVVQTTGYTAVAVDSAGNVYATQQYLYSVPNTVTVNNQIEAVGGPSAYSSVVELGSSGTLSTVMQISPPTAALATYGTVLYGSTAGEILQPPSPYPLNVLGIPGLGQNQSDNVSSMAFDPSGRLYVVSGNAIYFAQTKNVSAAPVILFEPQEVTVLYGTSTTLSVAASADASPYPLHYQWYLNGTAVPGATASSFSVSAPGAYSVVVSNPAGSVTSTPAIVTTVTSAGASVSATPTITAQPVLTPIYYGESSTVSVSALSTLPLSYQWQLNGTVIPGATASSYNATLPGYYSVVVSTSAGSTTSATAPVILQNRLANLSTRADVGTGSAISIAGFVVAADPGSTKQVLIRAVGPSLAQFGVTGLLAKPVLTVFNSANLPIATNTGWNSSTVVSSAATASGAFPLQPGSADSALVLTLAGGSYTAQVSGAGGSTGVALIEVYEVAPDSSHFINISTRSAVGTGADIMIGGFVVQGTSQVNVLVRAAGPALEQFNVGTTLANPVLSIYDSSGQLIAINSGWSNGTSSDAIAVANAAAAAGSFSFAPGSSDCALLLLLAPGAYTAQVTGADGKTGIALFEAYQVPFSTD
jgi:hypothetical protein